MRKWRGACIVTLIAATAACERAAPMASGQLAQTISLTGPPDSDAVMGSLTSLARHIVAGLQDPHVRAAVSRAMKDPNSGGSLDLLACDPGTVVGNALLAGQVRGGQRAEVLCNTIRQSGGLVLYMSADRLAGWDSSVIPVVTALAKPDAGIPATFHGYRSPERIINVPRDGSLSGPILVLLPYLHTSRFPTRIARLLPSVGIQVAPSPGGLVLPPQIP